MSRLHPTPPTAARKEVRVYASTGKLLSSKTWRIKRLSSKKLKVRQ